MISRSKTLFIKEWVSQSVKIFLKNISVTRATRESLLEARVFQMHLNLRALCIWISMIQALSSNV